MIPRFTNHLDRLFQSSYLRLIPVPWPRLKSVLWVWFENQTWLCIYHSTSKSIPLKLRHQLLPLLFYRLGCCFPTVWSRTLSSIDKHRIRCPTGYISSYPRTNYKHPVNHSCQGQLQNYVGASLYVGYLLTSRTSTLASTLSYSIDSTVSTSAVLEDTSALEEGGKFS